MALDGLKHLTSNIPNWLIRLDDLTSQVDRRQQELAAIAAQTDSKTAETRLLRNKGSQESLKPQDDGPSNIPEPELEPEQSETLPDTTESPEPLTPSSAAQDNQKKPPTPGSGGRGSQNRPRDALAAAHSRARAHVKKRQRSASVVSAEPTTTTFRTRSMIIVWYDSYVQGFFDDLVRFVSSSRNMMRKAKMAAKVAQIKRMAERETNGENDETGDPLPSLKHVSSRRFGPTGMGRPGFGPPGANDPPDAYDGLDKGLEFVQSTCEHGAHQFLRDADCHDEINKIKQKLQDVMEMADKEADRLFREQPELAKENGEANKARTRRPISMRREPSAFKKEPTRGVEVDSNGGVELKGSPDKIEPAESINSKNPSIIEPASNSALEVDISPDGAEVDMVDYTNYQYRSPRYMRARAA